MSSGLLSHFRMEVDRHNHRQGFVQYYWNIPFITRVYTTASLLLTLAVNAELISHFQLYLNFTLITERYQIWRVLTCFLYAGSVRFTTVFHLLCAYRYSRIVEETFFHSRTSDYLFMCLFMAAIILGLSVTFTNLLFLGEAFTHALLYLWCRRNANTSVILLGLFTMRANLAPYVILGLSIMGGSSVAGDIIAMIAGHCYYFLEDVFPYQPLGFRILKTPRFLKVIFNEHPESLDPVHGALAVVDQNNNVIGNDHL